MRSRVLSALIASLCLIPVGRVTAQTFTTLYSFTGGSDGINPYGGLLLLGNTLYGTTSGGIYLNGTVFKVNTDGTGFSPLHTFVGSDGANPMAGLILSGNILYGTTYNGGSNGAGTVFKMNTDGTGFTTVYTFTNYSDGLHPQAGLVLSGNSLYGTTLGGGSDNSLGPTGTIFKVSTDGLVFMVLHTFTGNSDGAEPAGGLILSGNTLYGTAQDGGLSIDGREVVLGTVFAINTDGTGFTVLHSFDNSDGTDPSGQLILSGNTLYGTTKGGGNYGVGTIFQVNTDGTGFTNLYLDFNLDNGENPVAGLILSGNTLYGTTSQGTDYPSYLGGTVFSINTDGTSYTTLHAFNQEGQKGIGGDNPYAGLILSGYTLYGTTYNGSDVQNVNYGTIFSLTFGSPTTPPLAIIPSGTNVVLMWPTNAIGFTLESTTNLASPHGWNPVSPGPVVTYGQYTVTNPISGTQQFYRLGQ